MMNLPAEIADRIEGLQEADPLHARLGNTVHFVQDRSKCPAVLKIGRGRAAADMRAEAERLGWLQEKLVIPKILAQITDRDVEYVLLTRLPGRPAHEIPEGCSSEDIVRQFALCLKEIHLVAISACPFVNVTRQEMARAIAATERDQIDRQSFISDTDDTPEAILDFLNSRLDLIQEDIFTHGDYCLPNLLIEHGTFQGAVDWGLAGVSDRHRDFMSAELTLRRNFDAILIPLFYEVYGVEDIDPARIRFYWLLDRFSQHLKAS